MLTKMQFHVRKNRQKGLLLHSFYVIILSCVDLLPFSTERKEIH